ncbi:DUF4333 domain-containing protein [Tsukamurella sputi]|uniref:DUF4333 domain-containing protein n=1 Tax=Tsukamurella sputi TaxID=2591848 RepID=A0A5C5RRU3_9ACTN|nr:DUF4333 domain-containing protein [Tsukamurella sputi]TWS24835.1 DUF4333 domain-containing protein [Tsukamurella sputi]
MKRLVIGAAAVLVAGCSFDIGGASVDYGKLEGAITTKLNTEYGNLGHKVDSVSCDQSNKRPSVGSTFTCDVRISDAVVPVTVTVKDKDMNVDFVTAKKLYSLSALGPQLTPHVSAQLPGATAVDCGTGLKAVAPKESFTCRVANSDGTVDTLTYTVGGTADEDGWEVA